MCHISALESPYYLFVQFLYLCTTHPHPHTGMAVYLLLRSYVMNLLSTYHGPGPPFEML